jgi:hypothetical protein
MSESKSAKETKAEVLAVLNNSRAELVAALDGLSNVLLGQGFVVVSAVGIALKFKVEGQQVFDPKPAGGPHLATRFTKNDAESVAASVVDGHGDHGKAVHVCVALKDAIAETDRVIAMIEAA